MVGSGGAGLKDGMYNLDLTDGGNSMNLGPNPTL